MKRRPPRERFWEKVDVRFNQSDCWLWTAGTTTRGYGSFRLGGGGSPAVYAHRFAYEQFYGEIPDGLVIDHVCRTLRCVNPAHLEAVTQRENVMRGDGPQLLAALNRNKTHCIHGHLFDEQNTGRTPKGARICRACNRDRYHARKRQPKGVI